MEEIKSMVARNRAHLGDLLKERGRAGAAVMEYRRALEENLESVPILNRLAGAAPGPGPEPEKPWTCCRGRRELSPDHPTVYTQLGQTYLKLKDFNEARRGFQDGHPDQPFQPGGPPGSGRGLRRRWETRGPPGREREASRKLTRVM